MVLARRFPNRRTPRGWVTGTVCAVACALFKLLLPRPPTSDDALLKFGTVGDLIASEWSMIRSLLSKVGSF